MGIHYFGSTRYSLVSGRLGAGVLTAHKKRLLYWSAIGLAFLLVLAFLILQLGNGGSHAAGMLPAAGGQPANNGNQSSLSAQSSITNGSSSVQVTANGQNMLVPDNGTVTKTIKGDNGNVTKVTISHNSSSTAAGSSSVELNVSAESSSRTSGPPAP